MLQPVNPECIHNALDWIETRTKNCFCGTYVRIMRSVPPSKNYSKFCRAIVATRYKC